MSDETMSFFALAGELMRAAGRPNESLDTQLEVAYRLSEKCNPPLPCPDGLAKFITADGTGKRK